MLVSAYHAIGAIACNMVKKIMILPHCRPHILQKPSRKYAEKEQEKVLLPVI